ncbi:MAG: type II/IV secretion system protein, partial [Pseudomonadota bacterium]
MNAREPAVLSPEMLHGARAAALAQGRPQMVVLQETAGLTPEELTRQLANLFCYPAWPMSKLQAA